MRAHLRIAGRSAVAMSLACGAWLWSAGSFVESTVLLPTPDIRQPSLHSCRASTISLSRADVDAWLDSLEEPTGTCRVVPAFENERTIGIKLFSIRPRSFGTRLCLRNGDVVTRVHGYDMSSPESGVELLKRLREATHVDVELRREGKPMSISYVIE